MFERKRAISQDEGQSELFPSVEIHTNENDKVLELRRGGTMSANYKASPEVIFPHVCRRGSGCKRSLRGEIQKQNPDWELSELKLPAILAVNLLVAYKIVQEGVGESGIIYLTTQCSQAKIKEPKVKPGISP
jgi:hypothetical protein